MKLIRFGAAGQEKPGVIVNDTWFDVSHLVDDYNEAFFGGDAIGKLKSDVQKGGLTEVNKSTRLGSPLTRPQKLFV